MKSLTALQKKMDALEDILNPKRIIGIDYAAFTEEEHKVMCEASRILEMCAVVENGERLDVTATDAQHEVLEKAVQILERHTIAEYEITEVHTGTGGKLAEVHVGSRRSDIH